MKKIGTLVFAACISTAVSAQIISVNIQGTGAVMEPTDKAGVIEAAYWNNWEYVSGGSTTVNPLLDNHGNDMYLNGEGVLIDCKWLSANYNIGDLKSGNGNDKMFSGTTGRAAKGGGGDIDVQYLPESFIKDGYDVYVYWGNHTDWELREVVYRLKTINGEMIGSDDNEYWISADGYNYTKGGELIQSTAKTLSEAQAVTKPGNYVVFKDLHEESFKIETKCEQMRGAVSGIQIVAKTSSFVNEIKAQDFEVYVANDILYVKNISGKEVQVLNLLGEIVFENYSKDNECQIFVCGWIPGVYLVKCDKDVKKVLIY